MDTETDISKVWAVIMVRRGIFNQIFLFRDEDAAYQEYNNHIDSINSEDDDLQILHIPIDGMNIA